MRHSVHVTRQLQAPSRPATCAKMRVVDIVLVFVFVRIVGFGAVMEEKDQNEIGQSLRLAIGF